MTTVFPSEDCSNSNLITFEDVPTTDAIPNGYFDLIWNNAYIIDTTIYSQWSGSGFHTALTSGKIVAYNMNGDRMSISSRANSSNGVFTINSFVAAAAWNDNLYFTVIGQRLSTILYTKTIILQKTLSKLIVLNWTNIDQIIFYGSGRPPNGDVFNSREIFVIDNLCLR
ncbi:unnamed protein product [Didymodactylos carnosus]|uniref:Uncharacterized protein n=1 Tax=Didymodactylos carnosus TaxID=1234261 RepID=A0A816F5P6_9BILA|nr:unnamed protein product [Didymodactylos carnosus]CAF4591308.1 unnamed protein product [Didymodactylos carnosus]